MKSILINILFFLMLTHLSSCKKDPLPLEEDLKFLEGKWAFDHFEIMARGYSYYDDYDYTNVSKDKTLGHQQFELEFNGQSVTYIIDGKDSATCNFVVEYQFEKTIDSSEYIVADLRLDNENEKIIQVIYKRNSTELFCSDGFVKLDVNKLGTSQDYLTNTTKRYYKKIE